MRRRVETVACIGVPRITVDDGGVTAVATIGTWEPGERVVILPADELEAMERALTAAYALHGGWAEGGCIVTPPCGDCTWCRFSDTLAALRVVTHRSGTRPTGRDD